MNNKSFNLFLIGILTSTFTFAQDLSEEAKKYFSNYMDNISFFNMVEKVTPSLADSKLVFKDDKATVYYDFVTANMSKMAIKPDSVIKYEDIRIESFTTEDILADKKNYAGGMARIKDYLKPNITFYEVNYLKKVGDKYGMAFKFFININGKWIIFPKPWRAFEEKKAVDK